MILRPSGLSAILLEAYLTSRAKAGPTVLSVLTLLFVAATLPTIFTVGGGVLYSKTIRHPLHLILDSPITKLMMLK